jgi:hypothetical protein
MKDSGSEVSFVLCLTLPVLVVMNLSSVMCIACDTDHSLVLVCMISIKCVCMHNRPVHCSCELLSLYSGTPCVFTN